MSQCFRAAGFRVAIVLTLLGLTQIPLPMLAQSSLLQFQPDKVFKNFPLKGKTNSPTGTISKPVGCPKTDLPLTAFVPSSSDTHHVAGLTVSEHPTFWFYMPYTYTDNFSAPFVLKDSQGAEVYSTAVDLPAKPGVISVPIPVSLEPQEWYQWSLNFECQNPPITTSGWIQRVNPPAAIKPSAPKSLQQAALYAQNNLWFDALTTLMELHQAKPQDPTIATNLKTLLIQGRVKETTADQAIAK